MKKIYIGMPSATWFPYPEAIINIYNQILPDDVEIEFERKNIIDRMPVQLARNEIIQQYLYHSDAEYFLFCDDDNPMAHDVISKLISHDKDVCSALVPLRKWPYRLCVVKDWKPIESIEWMQWPLIEVDNIGTWCVLMKRQVIQDVWNKNCWHPYQFRVEDTVWNKKDDHK